MNRSIRVATVIVTLACALTTVAVASAATTKPSKLLAQRAKVVIAGTNDGTDVTDGSLSGTGTFKATGAITDNGTARGYRTVQGDPSSAAGAMITLRFVTKGKKGTITYVVKIDTKAGTARWTIASGTKAYKGLHGKGTESENGGFTVSTLKGTVSR
jgi:hypothetical protein